MNSSKCQGIVCVCAKLATSLSGNVLGLRHIELLVVNVSSLSGGGR